MKKIFAIQNKIKKMSIIPKYKKYFADTRKDDDLTDKFDAVKLDIYIFPDEKLFDEFLGEIGGADVSDWYPGQYAVALQVGKSKSGDWGM
jgi:hypothetical protein